jgi:hypothetical protein
MNRPDLTMTEATIGRRQEARLRVRLDARLITLDGSCRAVLADISTHGARIATGTCTLRAGQEAVLNWNRGEAFGMVVWSADGQCGLRFYDPLDQRTVLAARQLDEHSHLPDDRELVRRSAQSFVQGRGRL